MQPTRTQIERSLDALEQTETEGVAESDLRSTLSRDIPAGLVERLAALRLMRVDRIAEARLRLEAGHGPTADDLADRLVGRLVCDRLR